MKPLSFEWKYTEDEYKVWSLFINGEERYHLFESPLDESDKDCRDRVFHGSALDIQVSTIYSEANKERKLSMVQSAIEAIIRDRG
jgi:hypothetical protein